MILGVHHTAISTGDIQRLIGFYTGLLGFTLVHRHEWEPGAPVQNRLLGTQGAQAQMAMLRHHNCFLELFQFSSPEPEMRDREQRLFGAGLTHIGLVVSDIRGEYARLLAAGMPFNSEPLARPGLTAVYGRDPDGNVVELLEFHDPDQVFAPHWQMPDTV